MGKKEGEIILFELFQTCRHDCHLKQLGAIVVRDTTDLMLLSVCFPKYQYVSVRQDVTPPA